MTEEKSDLTSATAERCAVLKVEKSRISPKLAYFIAIIGVVLALVMAAAVVYYWEFVRGLEAYGYLGAFLISIFGGATIIIPVPMLAVVFALGGVMKFPWLVGICAALGDTIGAMTIYMTGHGAGTALIGRQGGRLQSIYERLMRHMEKRGSVTVFLLASVINPFFYPAAIIAGACRFSFRRYIILALTGKTIKAMTIVYAGWFGLRGILRWLGAPL